MKVRPENLTLAIAALFVTALLHGPASAATTGSWKVIAWNDLGMHCTDGNDFGVFSVLPPYNTIAAQVVDPSGKLLKTGSGITVTYEAVADPDGSINRTSVGKANFWDYVLALFGVKLSPDVGLKGFAMPGSRNRRQAMRFDGTRNLFIAEGIPITPYDDAGRKNYYPMMRVVARDSSGTVLASTNIVLPVSDEMDCKTCHASGSDSFAMPKAGWVYDSNPARDVKFNILRLKDEELLNPSNPSYAKYLDRLVKLGYKREGLYATAKSGTPVLCDNCHVSNAMPGYGDASFKPLTEAMHSRHASVFDPITGIRLGDDANRASCYRCHPGSETACLRGAMSTTPDIQCQSCHGTMAQVGKTGRAGWLDVPACQSCHTGTAVDNNGAIRFTSVYESSGAVRVAQNATFATNPDTPATGLSMYRFSKGHGGLQCEACHGSTHAEYPTTHRNDNLQNIALQGHSGTLAECAACHGTAPSTVQGGPHGVHPVGQTWVGRHGDIAEQSGTAQCRDCHGETYRGTVLSRALTDRTFQTKWGTKTFARGTQIGCYSCHNGPNSD